MSGANDPTRIHAIDVHLVPAAHPTEVRSSLAFVDCCAGRNANRDNVKGVKTPVQRRNLVFCRLTPLAERAGFPCKSAMTEFTHPTGRRMYGAGDALPRVYKERFRTQMYSQRVVYPGVWNKVAVVAREDDDETMLNHALIQSRRRYGR
jgi:hypothetical protein